MNRLDFYEDFFNIWTFICKIFPPCDCLKPQRLYINNKHTD